MSAAYSSCSALLAGSFNTSEHGIGPSRLELSGLRLWVHVNTKPGPLQPAIYNLPDELWAFGKGGFHPKRFGIDE